MRKLVFTGWVVGLWGLTACSVGCDAEAEGRSRSAAQLDKALSLIADAERGYVPGADAEQTLREYRLEKLSQAAQTLEEAASSGGIRQQIGARRLLSTVKASAVRDSARQAIAAWAELANKSATLVNLMGHISQATDRVEALSRDDTGLIDQLEGTLDQTRGRLGDIERDIRTLDEKIGGLERRIEGLDQDRRQAVARAGELRQQAFDAEGERKYELQVQSLQAQRRAEEAAAKADEIKVQVDIIDAERQVLQRQLELARERASSLEEKIEDARTRRQEREELRRQAQRDREEALEEFTSLYDQLAEAMQDDVFSSLETGRDTLAELTEQLRGIEDQAPGDLRPAVQLDRLDTMIERAFLFTQHALVLGSYGQTLSLVAEHMQRLTPDQSSAYTSNSNQLVVQQQELIDEANDLLTRADELAQELATRGGSLDDPDSVASSAAERRERIRTYQRHLEEASLQ